MRGRVEPNGYASHGGLGTIDPIGHGLCDDRQRRHIDNALQALTDGLAAELRAEMSGWHKDNG